MALLDGITYPRDLRRLERDDLAALVDEVRARHIDVVSQKCGHSVQASV